MSRLEVDHGKGRRGKGPTPGSFKPGNEIGTKKVSNMPKGRFITAQLIRMMQEEIDDPEFDPKNKAMVKQRAKAVYFFCRKLMKLALDGDVTCLKMIMDRIEGTAVSTTIFKSTDDPENVTPEQSAALAVTREKLAAMTPDARLALYNATLTDNSGVQGRA